MINYKKLFLIPAQDYKKPPINLNYTAVDTLNVQNQIKDQSKVEHQHSFPSYSEKVKHIGPPVVHYGTPFRETTQQATGQQIESNDATPRVNKTYAQRQKEGLPQPSPINVETQSSPQNQIDSHSQQVPVHGPTSENVSNGHGRVDSRPLYDVGHENMHESDHQPTPVNSTVLTNIHESPRRVVQNVLPVPNIITPIPNTNKTRSSVSHEPPPPHEPFFAKDSQTVLDQVDLYSKQRESNQRRSAFPIPDHRRTSVSSLASFFDQNAMGEPNHDQHSKNNRGNDKPSHGSNHVHINDHIDNLYDSILPSSSVANLSRRFDQSNVSNLVSDHVRNLEQDLTKKVTKKPESKNKNFKSSLKNSVKNFEHTINLRKKKKPVNYNEDFDVSV